MPMQQVTPEVPQRVESRHKQPTHQARQAHAAAVAVQMKAAAADPSALITRRCDELTGFLVAQGWLSGSSTSSRSSRWLALNNIKQHKCKAVKTRFNTILGWCWRPIVCIVCTCHTC